MDNQQNFDLNILIERCRQETEKFQRAETHDDRYCFELLRRAIAERVTAAWDAVYQQYHRLVRVWVGSYRPDADDLVQEAFARFHSAIAPQEFTQKFGSVSAVLSYLRVCAQTAVNSAQRRRAAERHYVHEQEARLTAFSLDDVPARVLRQQLTAYIMAQMNDEQERVVVYHSFELDEKPREIHAQYTGLFADAQEVSKVKERIIKRLQRDPKLRKMLGKT